MNSVNTVIGDDFYIKFNFMENVEYFHTKIYNYIKNENNLNYEDILSDFTSWELKKIKKEDEFGFMNDDYKVNRDGLILYSYDKDADKYIKCFEPSERTFDCNFFKEKFGEILINFLNTDFNNFENAYKTFFRTYGFNILEQYNEQKKLKGTYYGKDYLDKILYLYNSSNKSIEEINKMQQLYKDAIDFIYYNTKNKKYSYYELFRAWVLMNYDGYLNSHSDNTIIISNEIDSLFYNVTREDLPNRCGVYSSDANTTGCVSLGINDILRAGKNLELDYNETNIYQCKDMFAVFYIVLNKFVQNSKMPIKKCEHCGKYFIPQNKSDEKYCNNKYRNTGKTCREIASKNNYIENIKKDNVMSEYTKAYQKKHKQILRNPDKKYLKQDFEIWKIKTKEKIKQYKQGKLDEQTVIKWILDTK